MPHSPQTFRSAAVALAPACGGRRCYRADTPAAFGAKLRQAKLALSGALAASPAYKRELDKRLQAFDRAVWVRLRA